MSGIAFRNTPAFVTNAAGDTYCVNDLYPTTRATIGPFGFDAVTSEEDLSAAVDPKLAGDNFRSHVNGPGLNTFRWDLAAGTYTIQLALGGVGVTNFPYIEVRDGTSGTIFFTINDVAGSSAGQFYDATGVKRTSAADWITNNASRTITLTGTQLVINIKNQDSLSGGRNAIAYVSMVAGSDTTPPVLTSPTVGSINYQGGTPSVTTDEANGTAYMVIVPNGNTPSVTQIKAGQNSSGGAALASQNRSVTATGSQAFTAVTSLSASTTYTCWFVHTDASNNNSTAVSTNFTTSATPSSTDIPAAWKPLAGGFGGLQ
jgi:hypothetical protein